MSRADTGREALQQRILEFVETFGTSESFEDLATALHTHQHRNDPVIRALSEGNAGIPAVPVGLFRDLHVGTVDASKPHAWFQTSGTSSGRSGIHRMWDTVTYDAGCHAWAARFLPQTTRTLALLHDNGHSSLAHMVRGFAPRTGPVTFVTDFRTIVVTEPTFVCTTAFALDHWLSMEPAPLPPGSAILTTGGFKGRVHERDADALIEAAAQLAPVVLEYGMTELSSQLWARPGEPYQPPPWLRVTAVDPWTGATLPAGELGQLRFMDLCNLDSAVHLETMDQGQVFADGTVQLHGRLPDAPVRGCSLSHEDLLGPA